MRQVKFLFLLLIVFLAGLWQAEAKVSSVSLLHVPGDYVDVDIDNSTLYGSLSANGRYLAFLSNVTGLVADDTNNLGDVFVLDRQTGQIERVSVTSAGAEARLGACCDEYPLAISGDGRYVVFSSFSSDLVANDTNTVQDIFLHDRQTGSTTMVSVNDAGDPSNGNSSYPSISSNGRYIAFQSEATNLVAGDDNGFTDIFIHDQQTGTTVRVSLTHDGLQSNHHSFIPVHHAISDNGRFVSFESYADNLVLNDLNSVRDAFVHDRDADGDGIFDEAGAITTVRVSVATDGIEGNGHLSESQQPALAGNGRFVVFQSFATNLVPDDTNQMLDVFIRDRDTDEDGIFDEPGAVLTERVSVASDGSQSNGGGGGPTVSANGRFVTFYSSATNLIPGGNVSQQNIYLHDRTTGETIRLSETSSGDNPNDDSTGAVIASAGNVVAFHSLADNLTDNDTNQTFDVFLYDPDAVITTSYELYLPTIVR